MWISYLNKSPFVVISLCLLLLLSCSSKTKKEYGIPKSVDFNQYWNKGKAEISIYSLEQSRYGEIHEGSASTIFVKEPFNSQSQVKADQIDSLTIDVLKLNMQKDFYTGIYPYDMMLSTFTPLESDSTSPIKITASVQEWCGQVFEQLNKRDSSWSIESFSYFEQEGDQKDTIEGAITEDGLWTRIRLSPESLPTGKQMIIPGAFYRKLRHKSFSPIEADLELKKESETSLYSIQYIDRILTIEFENALPHKILGWQETYSSGFAKYEKQLTSTAKLKKQVFIDYWNKNRLLDNNLRKELGL